MWGPTPPGPSSYGEWLFGTRRPLKLPIVGACAPRAILLKRLPPPDPLLHSGGCRPPNPFAFNPRRYRWSVHKIGSCGRRRGTGIPEQVQGKATRGPAPAGLRTGLVGKYRIEICEPRGRKSPYKTRPGARPWPAPRLAPTWNIPRIYDAPSACRFQHACTASVAAWSHKCLGPSARHVERSGHLAEPCTCFSIPSLIFELF
jgi:hypothetical protein